MSFKHIIPYFLLLTVLYSCGGKYKLVLNTPKKIQVNQPLTVSVHEKNNKPIDSVQFSIEGKKIIGSTPISANIDIDKYKLGKHTVSAVVFYENKTKKLTNTVYFLSDSSPDIYTFNIINTYPHDRDAYTQGLEFFNGYLYESTGHKGNSSLRKVNLETGEVVQQIDLDEEFFGEGITIFKDKIYQLTWKEGVGFIYDLKTFEKLGTFKYHKSLEGWGLTNNGEYLLKTDGTERIWFLNPDTLEEIYFIEAYTNKQKVEKLNELEYVNGKIYANRWQLNSILIIDPETGKIEGVANLNKLKELISKEQNLKKDDDVLNGIAYDKNSNRMFVTGKHWAKLYEIELVKK